MPRHSGQFFVLIVVGTALLGIGELMVRFLNPQQTMIPRFAFSEEYNTALPAGSKIRNSKPGAFQFVYTINNDGYRGPIVEANSARECIVVLGDSYSLGVGVNDGEEYPARMREEFGGHRDVVNLGVGGWGLSQQIRRYYNFGENFGPRTVVLQFCQNDPLDGLIHPVTRWQNGAFTFHPVQSSAKRYARFLGNSPIQNSQLYNFLRCQIWLMIRRSASEQRAENTSSEQGPSITAEEAYIELLIPFAQALKRDGVELIFISVEKSVEQFPEILATVEDLARTGQIHSLQVEPWLDGLVDYASPEGHAWGTEAHARIGQGLAHWITTNLPTDRAVTQK